MMSYTQTVESKFEELESKGYTVIEIFAPEEIKQVSEEFLQTAITAPELADDLMHNRFVMGGVGYCPFASLAYSKIVRKINDKVYKIALEKIFRNILSMPNEHDTLLSMLPDRSLFRFPSQKVDEKGKWHQDDAANANEQDRCYGGWINLNHDVTQYFKCIDGTHNPNHTIFNSLNQKNGANRGFADFNAADYKILENHWKQLGEKLVEIPPGHAMIFRETLIHTVFRNPPTKRCILRQHISFMLSKNNITLHDRPRNKKYARRPIREYFKDQELIPVRSGQETPVYSPFNLYPNNKPQVEELSRHYIEACKDNKGLVKRFLPSMKELNAKACIPMSEPMTEEEISKYIPHRP